ncbi:endonuclease [Bacteroidia bacterium]|nr:endonuclease [Bacteroidia bacterium]
MKKLSFVIVSMLLFVVAARSANSSKVEVKVTSYNIRFSNTADGEDRWDNRKGATLKMIQQENPSILGLQEALLEQVKYIEDNLPQYGRIGVGRDDGKESGEMMAIFYHKEKFTLLKSGTFWLSNTPDNVSRGWDAACNRTVTWVQLQEISSNKTFYFFNTHFDHKGTVARENSVKLVVEKIKEITGKKETVILCGDLNSTIADPIFNPLKKEMKNAREHSPITDNKGTFNGFGAAPTSLIIDYIFYKNAEPKSFKTLDGNYGAPYISDHYPIEFVFYFK